MLMNQYSVWIDLATKTLPSLPAPIYFQRELDHRVAMVAAERLIQQIVDSIATPPHGSPLLLATPTVSQSKYKWKDFYLYASLSMLCVCAHNYEHSTGRRHV